jgi:hypothetical protein
LGRIPVKDVDESLRNKRKSEPVPNYDIDPAEKKELPAWVPFVQQPPDELPSTVLVPRTFRLSQRLIEDLVSAGELTAFAWLDREGNIWLPIN